MKAINLKCNNCGANLTKIEKLDNTYVCTHCGNQQIILEEKTINENNYTIHQNIIKNVYGDEKPEYTELIVKAETYIKVIEYKKAIEIINKAIEENPANFEGWWLLTKAKILYNINQYEKNENVKTRQLYQYEEDYEKVIKLANKGELENINNEYEQLVQDLESLSENNDETNISIPANKRQKPKTNPLFIAFILCTMITVIFLIPMVLSMDSDDISGFILYMVLFIMFSLIFLVLWLQDKNLIIFINSKDRHTISEIMDVLDILNKQQAIDKLERLINAGVLINYELVNGKYLIKI